MPAGALVTVPGPTLVIVNGNSWCEKVAATLFAAFMVTIQLVADPEQAPLHPVKIEPALGVALMMTRVPSSNVAVHVEPQ